MLLNRAYGHDSINQLSIVIDISHRWLLLVRIIKDRDFPLVGDQVAQVLHVYWVSRIFTRAIGLQIQRQILVLPETEKKERMRKRERGGGRDS